MCHGPDAAGLDQCGGAGMTRFRLEFETVNPIVWPAAYRGDDPAVRPEDCPDAMWDPVSREASGDDISGIRDQYATLKRWADTGEQLIRNVHLYRASEPFWEEESHES